MASLYGAPILPTARPGMSLIAGADKAGINVDPPPGVPVIQGQADGSLVVYPLSYFGIQNEDDAGQLNLASLQVLRNGQGGLLRLAPFTFATQSMWQLPFNNDVAGSGPGTVIQPSGAGYSALYSHDLIGPPGGFGSYHGVGGRIRDLIIDGTNAGAASVGLDIGDSWGRKVQAVRVQNFTGTGAIGCYFANRKFWTEKCHFQMTLWGNTVQAVMDRPTGEASFEFTIFDLDIFALALQNGVIWQNGAYTQKGFFRLTGNMLTSAVAPSGVWAALQINGSGGGFFSQFKHADIHIELELDQTGNPYSPQTIVFGATTNFIGGTGQLIFSPVTNPAWANSNITPGAGQLTFGGEIFNDPTLIQNNSLPNGFANVGAAAKYSNPPDPASTVSLTPVMMGLGANAQITPLSTGRIRVTIVAYYTTATASVPMTIAPKYGLVSGGVPANGAAASGTGFGGAPQLTPPAGGGKGTYVCNVFLNLAPGSGAYWVDLALDTTNAANAASIVDVQVTFEEVAN